MPPRRTEVPPRDLSGNPSALARFQWEVRTASAHNHSNFSTIHETDRHDGQPFLAMELMRGGTLKERIATGPLEGGCGVKVVT